jgi:hypothetical protein
MSLREQIGIALSREEELLEQIRERVRNYGDPGANPNPPQWRTSAPPARGQHPDPEVRGSDGMIIYNEGGHDELDAQWIARHDPARGEQELALYRVILQGHQISPRLEKFSPLTGTYRGYCACGKFDDCPELTALWEVLQERQESVAAVSSRISLPAGILPATITTWLVLDDGTETEVPWMTWTKARSGSSLFTLGPAPRDLRVSTVLIKDGGGTVLVRHPVRDDLGCVFLKAGSTLSVQMQVT